MTGFVPKKRSLLARYWPLLLLFALIVLVAPLLINKTITLTRSTVLDEIKASRTHTLDLVVTNLYGELARFQALPHLLAAEPVFRKLWDRDKTREDVRRINLFLEKNQNITGSLDLFVIDATGKGLAASNWQESTTFIDQNFSDRPYFQEAMQGLFGRYFAVDPKTRARGYYFSYPIREGNKVLGVMVCKIDVGHLEEAWTTRRDEIIVSDNNGIIFLSSKKNWLFKSLAPLAKKRNENIRRSRQYDRMTIAPFTISNRTRIGNRSALIHVEPGMKTTRSDSNGNNIPLTQKTQFMQLHRNMLLIGWQVHILARTDEVRTQILRNSFAVGIALFALFIAGALLLQRARQNFDRREIQRVARAELEHRVKVRTSELQQVQSELIQAGKLAALGKLSAGLSHELNQPLAAIRSYSDNAGTFLQRGELAPAHNNLKNIGELTDRMARIIKHLRTYASKDKIEAGPTNIVVAVREALAILAHRIDKENVTIIDQLPDNEIIAHGGLVRLQQVFVNILANALDAVSTMDKKQVFITLEEQADMVIVMICDTGPGLTPIELDRVFDPFYSTKGVGEGVGLGLSISYGIISQFGGRIEVKNCTQRGAALRVALLKHSPAKETSPNV